MHARHSDNSKLLSHLALLPAQVPLDVELGILNVETQDSIFLAVQARLRIDVEQRTLLVAFGPNKGVDSSGAHKVIIIGTPEGSFGDRLKQTIRTVYCLCKIWT